MNDNSTPGTDASPGWGADPIRGSRSGASTGGQSAMTTGAADRRISPLGPEIPKTVRHPGTRIARIAVAT